MSLDELIEALLQCKEQGLPGDSTAFIDDQSGQLLVPTRVLVDADGDVLVVAQ
jgi:hypothetical protein